MPTPARGRLATRAAPTEVCAAAASQARRCQDGKIRALGMKKQDAAVLRRPVCSICGVIHPPRRRSGRTAGCGGRRCRCARCGSSSGGTWGLVQGDGDGAGDEAVLALLPSTAPGGDSDLGDDAREARSTPARKAASDSDTERVTSVSWAFLNRQRYGRSPGPCSPRRGG